MKNIEKTITTEAAEIEIYAEDYVQVTIRRNGESVSFYHDFTLQSNSKTAKAMIEKAAEIGLTADYEELYDALCEMDYASQDGWVTYAKQFKAFAECWKVTECEEIGEVLDAKFPEYDWEVMTNEGDTVEVWAFFPKGEGAVRFGQVAFTDVNGACSLYAFVDETSGLECVGEFSTIAEAIEAYEE